MLMFGAITCLVFGPIPNTNETEKKKLYGGRTYWVTFRRNRNKKEVFGAKFIK